MNIHKSYRKMCPDFIVNDFVTNIIKTVPLRVGYNTIRVTLKSDKVTDKTLTFSAMTMLSVVCRKGCLVDIVDVMVKSSPKNEKLREVIPVRQLFTREAFLYNTVLVELMEKVTDEDRFQGAPAMIAATLEEGAEALILSSSGEAWFPRFEKWVGELTQEHILAVVKEFGRFHALNFAFKKTNPKKFEEFKTELRGGYLSCLENAHTLKIIHSNLNATLKCINEDLVEVLKKFDKDVDNFLENVLNGSGDVEVLVHGDPTTNFLFSYEKADLNASKTVSRAKLLDWQLVRFGSPVLDLSVFLFTHCSYDDLTNSNQFLKEYHDCLDLSLKRLQCDVNDFLSFEDLQEEWKQNAKFGLALAFLNFEVLSLSSSKRPNANEDESAEEFLQSFTKPPNDDFMRRIKDVVKYCVDNELI